MRQVLLFVLTFYLSLGYKPKCKAISANLSTKAIFIFPASQATVALRQIATAIVLSPPKPKWIEYHISLGYRTFRF